MADSKTHARRRDLIIDVSLWTITAIFASLTAWFSLIAIPPGVDLIPMEDKGLHAVSYFATTLSLLFAAVWRPGRGEGPFPNLARWIFLAAVGAGIAVELLQGLTIRTPDVADVIAEAVGAGAAVLVHWLTRWAFSRGQRPTDRSSTG